MIATLPEAVPVHAVQHENPRGERESLACFDINQVLSCVNFLAAPYMTGCRLQSINVAEKPYAFFISTTHRMQSPCFITSKALLILSNGCRCVMNSSTFSLPVM